MNTISRMPKQPGTNAGQAPAGAAVNAGQEADAEPRAKPGPVTASTTATGATLAIEGELTGTGDVPVSGTVEGTVEVAANRVTVEGTGRVEGRIVDRQVRVKGEVDGDIEALDTLGIDSTGTVRGTIVAPRIEIRKGATLKCRIDTGFDEVRRAPAAPGLTKN